MIDELKLQAKIGFTPHKCQAEVLSSKSRDLCICAGRRFGKSAIAAYIAIRTLLSGDKEGKPVKIWIVSPTYDLSQRVFDYLVRWFSLAVPSQKGGISSRPFPQIRTAGGSIVQCKSAENPNGLLGEELDLLIIDEASRIPKNVYETYLFPTTTVRKGKTVFISTPFGKNWFFHKYLKLKETNGSFTYKSIDNPSVGADEIERAKGMLPEQVFKQEYEAAFLEDAASVFRGIHEIVSDGLLKDVVPGHPYCMGVDLGKVEDFTVITVIDKLTNEVVYWDRFNKIDYPFQKKRILEVAKRYNARVLIDATGGIAGSIKDDLERDGAMIDSFKLYTYDSERSSKKELVEKLSIYIQNKMLKIPNNPVLIDELESYGYQLTEKGNVQYSAPSGQHDDAVISLALAVWMLQGKPIIVNPIQHEIQQIRVQEKKKLKKSFI
jgi:hypothetical protein